MVSQIVEKINRENTKEDLTAFEIGDTVKVHVRITEGGKERIQVYTGTVIARDGGGSTETFTVRRIAHGVGVERVFPVHSPYLAKLEVDGSAHVRRSKLYYLRKLSGKKARLKRKINSSR